MPDIPGNTSTTATITIGGSASDQLEFVGDHDWFRIELQAGQKITITVDGLTLEDSLVSIRDASGVLLAENDDISLGTIRDSRLVFTAPEPGIYYIDVGAFDDDYAGTYQLNVDLWTPPPVGTTSEIADFLVYGYWGGESQHYNVTQGGTITYDFHSATDTNGVTIAGQNLANAALALWSDVTGITFVQVASGGQITFTDNETGAFSDSTVSGAFITSSNVNVHSSWLTQYGSTINTYAFQAYVHEVGHALGLGHSGHYNSTASFPDDASFLNDSWATSIMSYFDQQESSYFASLGFSFSYVNTPMLADIRAMATLYGVSTTTRTGDTTYGFGNNSTRSSYNANLDQITSYVVFDSGGTDTLNYSGFTANQVINLNPETYSNVGGGIGNVSIAFNTVIENAIGGSGNDTIIGNSANNTLTGNAGNDTLNGGDGADTLIGGFGTNTMTGGSGADFFRGTAADLSGDTITDLQTGDAIVITDASLAGFTFNLIGSTLTYTGGTLTLQGGISGTLVASAAAGGGVQLAIQTVVPVNDVRNDFNGDGRSDILWRSDAGELSNWLGQANGGWLTNDANAFTNVPTNWHVVGTGDFNGDTRDDILWRNDAGQLSNWLGQANGGFANNDANAFTSVPTSWHVVGTGDFNGDGKDDILWRNDNGQLSDWLGQANGGFVSNDANALTSVPTNWHVVGVGDFNGDTRDDILWRNDAGQLSNWLGQANGGFVTNDANAFSNAAPTNWHVAGVGDFNGDNRDDILWRSDAGELSNWLGTASGGWLTNDANAFTTVPTSWQVVAVGDYNGDNRDDILWRSNTGQLSNWLGTASGGFTNNDANAFSNAAPTNWHVQPDDFLL